MGKGSELGLGLVKIKLDKKFYYNVDDGLLTVGGFLTGFPYRLPD